MRIDQVQPHTPFVVTDYWSTDPAYQHALARQFAQTDNGRAAWPELSARLAAFSRAVQSDVRPIGQLLERPNVAPRLVQFNEWGQRVDRVETSEGWRGLLAWQTVNRIVGDAYPAEGQESVVKQASSANINTVSAGGRDRLGELARLYNFARSFIFSPDCHVSLCPTSMTDGAVRVLELYGTPKQKQLYVPKLLSPTYENAWFAGQWMTEVAGGSDVSMTETVAEPLLPRVVGQKAKAGDLFVVRGFKWFSSAADGHVSLALARTDPDRSKGSRGLSLFLIPLRKTDRPALPSGMTMYEHDETSPTSPFNGIKVHRLKNKLGTHHVPTAELELCGALAELVGEEGRGVAQIAQVLNITRIYSMNGSVSSVGRALHIVQSYSRNRQVGVHGKPMLLKDIALHNALLSAVSVQYRAMLQLQWNVTRLLGKSEARTATAADERRLRLLTPVGKAFCAVRASECVAQCIECMGGQGYMQENPLTTILRDDFVGRIWEGTPSVLSLDVARVHGQTKGLALSEWLVDSVQAVESSNDVLVRVVQDDERGSVRQALQRTVDTLRDTLNDIKAAYLAESSAALLAIDSRFARPLLDLLGIVEAGCQLLKQAAWSCSGTNSVGMAHGDAALEVHIANRWVCGAEGRLAQTRATLTALLDDTLHATVEHDIAHGSNNDTSSRPHSRRSSNIFNAPLSAKSKL